MGWKLILGLRMDSIGDHYNTTASLPGACGVRQVLSIEEHTGRAGGVCVPCK